MHVAKDLGIHKEALRGWVRQDKADRGERDDRLTADGRGELTAPAGVRWWALRRPSEFRPIRWGSRCAQARCGPLTGR
ncbi:hypothetical protein [Streptomyces sp. ISL-12]|uniref:hypothetical protein n=1 Tax=Streptomyces sp. ISL-12 TaxID=2819177 RepID=UPI0035ABB967